jgi:hypothetical protein
MRTHGHVRKSPGPRANPNVFYTQSDDDQVPGQFL